MAERSSAALIDTRSSLPGGVALNQCAPPSSECNTVPEVPATQHVDEDGADPASSGPPVGILVGRHPVSDFQRIKVPFVSGCHATEPSGEENSRPRLTLVLSASVDT